MRDEYDFSTGKRGPVLSSAGKTRITIYLDNDILDAFRERSHAARRGYQTLINQVLRQAVLPDNKAPAEDLEALLRRVIREELQREPNVE